MNTMTRTTSQYHFTVTKPATSEQAISELLNRMAKIAMEAEAMIEGSHVSARDCTAQITLRLTDDAAAEFTGNLFLHTTGPQASLQIVTGYGVHRRQVPAAIGTCNNVDTEHEQTPDCLEFRPINEGASR